MVDDISHRYDLTTAGGEGPRDSTSRSRKAPGAALVLGTLLLLIAHADPTAAQLATITFPNTAVGATSTVKCPTITASICFGQDCTGTGTVLSVTGPSAPFSVGKFSVLSNAEFFGGLCEAHPVTLPTTLAAGQILAYQATFAPTAAGTANGSLTFNTGGGPATVNLTGQGIATRADRGGLLLQANPVHVVPGKLLDLQYQTSPGTLQGPVDLYFAVVFPSGQLMFVTEQGDLSPGFQPFRRAFSVVDATLPLFSDYAPLGLAFGTYTFHMALVYAGADASNPQNWASALSSATVTYAPLSTAQTSIQSARGNPDLLVVTSLPDVNQKRETWMYLSGTPNRFVFVNGDSTGESSVALTPADIGPKVDPALFTPQTTLGDLTAALGPPTSVGPLEDAPEYQIVSYAVGLDVVFLNGRLSSAVTSHP
jgi:hypothetical protein